MTAEQEFRKIVKGCNFITPDVIKYGQKGGILFELSKGDIMGQKVFGVTIVKNGHHNHELSQAFNSQEDAEFYIDHL